MFRSKYVLSQRRQSKWRSRGVRCLLLLHVTWLIFASVGARADDKPAKSSATTPDRVIQIPTSSVWRIAYSPDGKQLAVTTGDWTRKGDRQVNCLVRLLDVETGKEVRRFEGHTDQIVSVAFSPDGKRLLSASDDKSVRVWDVATGGEKGQFACRAQKVRGAAFAADGKTIAVGCDTVIHFLDVASGQQTLRPAVHRTAVKSLVVSLSGKHLLTGGGSKYYSKRISNTIPEDCRIHVWDLATGQEIQQFQLSISPVVSVAFSPDGKFALSGSGYIRSRGGSEYLPVDCVVRLWDIEKPNPVSSFEGHTNTVSTVAFSPNGKFAVSGSEDRTVRVWDISTNKELQRFTLEEEVSYVTCSPDGKFAVACAGDKTIWFWRITNTK
jgi:WD40 repeat protein